MRLFNKKIFRLTGVMIAILAWIIIFISIAQNPWFVFINHAFSDLGGPQANRPWIFNYGLMLLSILSSLYSFSLIKDATNKIETVGGTFMLIASVFLALIGIYPSGTNPHTFVSIGFFIQSDLVIIAWGIGLLFRGLKRLGTLFSVIGILGPLVALIVQWPSIAILETFSILIIDLWVILMFKVSTIAETKPDEKNRLKDLK